MSELKAMTVMDACLLTYSDNGLVYLKSEVDKVIAELDERFFELQETAIKIDKKLTTTRKQLRHHKYKRCLAMARWCNRMFSITFGKERYWQKWNRRWQELAEKFKEAK